MNGNLEEAKKAVLEAEATISKIGGLISSETERASTSSAEADTMRSALEEGESELALARADGVPAKEVTAKSKELLALRTAMDAKYSEGVSAAMAAKGLAVRLEQAKATLGRCDLAYHKKCEELVLEKAEAIGKEYLAKLLDCRELHTKLLALNSLQGKTLRFQGKRDNPTFGNFNRVFEIPVGHFMLKSFDGFSDYSRASADMGAAAVQIGQELGIESLGRRPPQEEIVNQGAPWPVGGQRVTVSPCHATTI